MTEERDGVPGFYDVFISYRHRDEDKVRQLAKTIRDYKFTPFLDAEIAELADTGNVTRQKVEIIRKKISRATCLILACSKGQKDPANPASAHTVGVWTPWELGFFDGSISSRIGVYLLDGKPEAFDAKEYFNGSEYLQLYRTLSDSDLKDFLDRNALRERRIDNVAGAFVWLQNLAEEWVANPFNVSLGVAEWYADHADRFWRERGVSVWADYFAGLKVQLDDLRVSWSPQLRSNVFDSMRNQMPSSKYETKHDQVHPFVTQMP